MRIKLKSHHEGSDAVGSHLKLVEAGKRNLITEKIIQATDIEKV